MAKITTSKGTRRTLGYYTAYAYNRGMKDEYWMRVQEITSKTGRKIVIEYWVVVRQMSDTEPGTPIQAWAQLHSIGTQPIALEEIVATMSTPKALSKMPYPLWCDGIDWQRVDSPPWVWV